jgi:orotidine-5'-phosphate decarboxylase
LKTGDGKLFYEEVILRSQRWGTSENMMYVVGATRVDTMQAIRKLAPDHFFLVPGIGAQGGDLEEVSRLGLTSDCGLLVNSARSIIYASDKQDFAAAARREAQALQGQMKALLEKFS